MTRAPLSRTPRVGRQHEAFPVVDSAIIQIMGRYSRSTTEQKPAMHASASEQQSP